MRLIVVLLVSVALAPAVAAHCDSLDGPVVTTARQALDSGNLAPVLAWVQPADEAGIREAFARAREVRAAGGAARELADRYFFETVVRIHRAGEGAPYTGLAPAGSAGPLVAAVDKAVASGDADALVRMITEAAQASVREHFAHVTHAKHHARQDVESQRRFVAAYVELVHLVEGLHQAAAGGGHGGEGEEKAAF